MKDEDREDKLREILGSGFELWTSEDIKTVLDDLDEGGNYTRIILMELLEEVEKLEASTCVTCGSKVATDKCFTMQFELKGQLSEAHFCGLDCMEYFINRLKKIKSED